MDKRLKLIICWGLIAIGLVQIGIFTAKYVSFVISVRNPLIPEGVTAYVGKQTLGICLLYLLAILPNIYYLVKRRNFIVSCVVSLIILLIIRFFMADIVAMLS